MGTDKAQLQINGERLVDRAAGTLASFCTHVLVASGGGARLERLRWPQISDPVPNAGPLAGITAGLERATTPLVAVLAVDMPHASPAVFELLLREWLAARSEPPAAIPVVDGHPQPLHALWAAGTAMELRTLFVAGERSPAAAAARLNALLVPPETWRAADPSGMFARNLNRPEDVARFRGPIAPPGLGAGNEG